MHILVNRKKSCLLFLFYNPKSLMSFKIFRYVDDKWKGRKSYKYSTNLSICCVIVALTPAVKLLSWHSNNLNNGATWGRTVISGTKWFVKFILPQPPLKIFENSTTRKRDLSITQTCKTKGITSLLFSI